MIYGRKQKHLESNKEYDYIACLYPEGNLRADKCVFFNDEDIAEIIQMIFDRYIHTNDGTKTRMICRWAIIRVLHYPDSYTSLSRYAFNLFFSSM